MSQATLEIPTSGTLPGLTLVNNINAALDALVTQNSGSSAPSNAGSGSPEEGQLWLNSSASQRSLEIYDGSQWQVIATYDPSTHVWKPGIGGGSGTLASAASTDLGSVPDSFVSITGTTSITGFGSSAGIGESKILKFAGILTLTNSSSLILPGGANITTAAGDVAIATQVSASVWTLVYFRANGQAVSPPPGLIVIPSTISGLLPSSITGANTTATMNVAKGTTADSTAAQYIISATALSWAVSNGNAIGGYQGGTTLPNSSTIHMFLCVGASGVGIFASLSATAPTLPSGYNTAFRRIFSFRTNGSGAPIPFVAEELSGGAMRAYYVTQITDGNPASITTAGVSVPLTIPSGILVGWLGRFLTQTGFFTVAFSQNETPTTPSNTGEPLVDAYNLQQAASPQLTTSNGALVFQTAGGTSSTYISTRGFDDFRRG